MINIKKYWDQKISLEEYISLTEERLNNPETTEEYKEYYKLGLQRMERATKTVEFSNEELQKVKDSGFNGKILIISEPWCGDASSTVPAVYLFCKMAGLPVGIFLRDSDTTLIDMFLTNGTQSIPKILVLNSDNEVLAEWGPRTAYGTSLLQQYKNDPQGYPKDRFYADLQVYYAKNKGQDVIRELTTILTTLS